MAPYSMRCNTCGECASALWAIALSSHGLTGRTDIYKGKKFNARKETAMGEEYYGIKVR